MRQAGREGVVTSLCINHLRPERWLLSTLRIIKFMYFNSCFSRHVVGDHWMKDQELFFEFTRYEPPRPHLTLLRAFVEDHLQDPETRRQLRKSLQNNDALVFSPAENAFAFPVSRDVTWQAV